MNKKKILKNSLDNNTIKITFDDNYYKKIFWNNDFLKEYGKEIIENLFNTENNHMIVIYLDEYLRIKYLSTVYNILTKANYTKKKFNDNILFIITKISDKLISQFRYDINEKALELIYFGALCIAYKLETGRIIKFSTFETCLKHCLINKKLLKIFEKTINDILDYNYLFSYLSDFLEIYKNMDKAQSIKDLDNVCKLLIKFALFTKKFSEQKTSLMTLTAYYFGKLIITKNFNWSYHIQLLTGYDKKIIKENIKEFIYELKLNYDFFIKLLKNDFDNSIFNIDNN